MPVSARLLQRKCACGGTPGPTGECEACRQKRAAATLQRTASHAAVNPVAPPIVHNVLRSPGQPLDATTRSFMEPRFGHDFSQVRVHTDQQAIASAQAVKAHAYTVGQNIVFAPGQYAPDSLVGRRLLAHELTHVVQQQGGHFVGLQAAGASNDDVDDLEREAESTADEVAATPPEVATNQESADAPVAAQAETPAQKPAPAKKPAKKPKEPPNPCTRTILAEGSCAYLVRNSKWVCCDPDHGIEDKTRTQSAAEPDKECQSQKWTPIFTCDANCAKALAKGCDDNDNWMAIPGPQFARSKCNDVYTICANGKQTTGYVRDRSVTDTRYEVSPGIQKALGVKVGDSFKGSVYRPGAKQSTIDKDRCCKAA